jgi:hypothetical protein
LEVLVWPGRVGSDDVVLRLMAKIMLEEDPDVPAR